MKKKVYLARDEDGRYGLFLTKPTLDNWSPEYWVGDKIITRLCKDLAKQWFGLKHHLRMKTCIRGTFSVSFTPDKKKEK